jgi:hypothetical protein
LAATEAALVATAAAGAAHSAAPSSLELVLVGILFVASGIVLLRDWGGLASRYFEWMTRSPRGDLLIGREDTIRRIMGWAWVTIGSGFFIVGCWTLAS